MNIGLATERHYRRSESARRLDRVSRQLIHQTEVYGYYARLYYLEIDDSFYLQWRLPEEGGGDKYYVNVDDCFDSLRYCLELLERFHPGVKQATVSALRIEPKAGGGVHISLRTTGP